MGEMVTQLAEQVSRLIREELRLAQAEMAQRASARVWAQGCSAAAVLPPCTG
jgi:putative superfamily III holin-X